MTLMILKKLRNLDNDDAADVLPNSVFTYDIMNLSYNNF